MKLHTLHGSIAMAMTRTGSDRRPAGPGMKFQGFIAMAAAAALGLGFTAPAAAQDLS